MPNTSITDMKMIATKSAKPREESALRISRALFLFFIAMA